MIFKYIIGGKSVQCDRYLYRNIVTIYDENGESSEYEICKLPDGRKGFNVNGETILLDDFICVTPQELVDSFARVDDDQLYQVNMKYNMARNLCQVLMKYGMDCLTVRKRVRPLEHYNLGGLDVSIAPSSTHDDTKAMAWVDYHFVNEDGTSDPAEGYKLELAPKDRKLADVYPSQRTYLSDLVSLFIENREIYQLVVNVLPSLTVDTAVC